VTLKLQEEEEEQLLAQYYIACAADAKFLILYVTRFLQYLFVTTCADMLSLSCAWYPASA
jgi:hypothetical protein